MPRFAVTQREFNDIWKHIDTTNSEMGCVKDEIVRMRVSLEGVQKDVEWIKTYLPPLVIVVTLLGSVAAYFLSK